MGGAAFDLIHPCNANADKNLKFFSLLSEKGLKIRRLQLFETEKNIL